MKIKFRGKTLKDEMIIEGLMTQNPDNGKYIIWKDGIGQYVETESIQVLIGPDSSGIILPVKFDPE